MRAQVAYLARLAGRSAGKAALRPPRPLFPHEIDSPTSWPGASKPAGQQGLDAKAPAPPASRADGKPTAAVPQAAVSAEQAMAPLPPAGSPAAAHAAGIQPPRSWPDPLWATPVDLPHTTGLPPLTGGTDGRTASAPRSRPAAPAPGPGAGQAARPGRGQDSHSVQNHGQDTGDTGIRGTLGDRPAAGPDRSPAPATAGPDRRDAVTPLPPGGSPSAAHAARTQPPPYHGQDTGDTGIRGTLGDRPAAGPDRSPAPATAGPDRLKLTTAAGDLLPPPATAMHAIPAGLEPAGRHREQSPQGQPRVSIGTIEVTVVPAAPPAPEISQNTPPADTRHGWSPAASPLAVGIHAGRLQQGLRRWYGIAQS
jgi:hypothetical protein